MHKLFRSDGQKNLKNEQTIQCGTDKFVQRQSDSFYKRECIEGKHLLIQTDEMGLPVATSASIKKDKTDKTKADALRLEGELDFINKVYDLNYTILENEEEDSFLKNLLPKNRPLRGSLDTAYNIIFKIEGNYLVLYKASKILKIYLILKLLLLKNLMEEALQILMVIIWFLC